MVFCGIYLRAISQELLMNLIHNRYSEITLLKLFLHLPGAYEFTLVELNNGDVILHPFNKQFNLTAIEGVVWMNNYIPHKISDIITYPYII